MNIMAMPEVSYGTREYEVVPELDKNAAITQECARRICEALDKSGFVVIPGMHSGAEAKRRDFYPLPASDNLLLLAATLCQRSRRVLKEYCGTSRSVL
jgi:ectoine hydroxylase-related dioxygenase (phytanoyl-CoA dioxygenase family)